MTMRIGVVCLVLAGWLGAAPADVIIDNGESLHLQPGLPSGGGSLSVDDFVLVDGANTITDIHWWGYYLSGSSDDFSIYIFDTLDNAPLYSIDGAATVRHDTGFDLSPGPGFLLEYYYSLYIDPLALTPGQTYWLGINNEASASWQWTLSATANGNAQVIEPTSQTTRWELAFNLTGPVVPEPTSAYLLLFGIGSLYIRRSNKY